MKGESPLTNRDFEILQIIAQYGVATATDISTLQFWRDDTGVPIPHKWQPIPHSNCQFRLKLLREAKYIDYIEQPTISTEGRKPYLYILTPKGARALSDHQGCEIRDLAWRSINKKSSTLFLEHLKWINTCRTAFTYAIMLSERACRLVTWCDDAHLKRTHSKLKLEGKPVVIPDGYFQFYVQHPNPFHYNQFLEVDRGTETGASNVAERATWERKVRMYNELFASGLFEKEYDVPNGRVLTVTTSERRLTHLKEITKKAGGGPRFVFTTFDKMTAVAHNEATYHTVLTNPIWQKAGKEGLYPFWLD